jgi:riboflavin kinase/FMN adenylyltransferase
MVRLWHGMDDVPGDWGASVVTIGVFDGVHRGHQRLVGRAVEIAAARGRPAVAVTFDPHPEEVLRPGTRPPYLCTVRRRAELLGALGADAVCVVAFSYEFSQLRPEDFVRAVLADRLHAVAVVVGENFRFGHKAAGDPALLAQLGEKYEFTAEGVPLLGDDGAVISSSSIREQLARGDVQDAARALGRPHRLEGTVVRGHHRGRALGFPTANLECLPNLVIPADGVYAGWLTGSGPAAGTDGEHGGDAAGAGDGTAPERSIGRWPAAISVGTNPTFGAGERSVEAYALDRDDLDLYGTHAAVDFTGRLRGMEKFGSADELAAQMRRDADAARELTL